MKHSEDQKYHIYAPFDDGEFMDICLHLNIYNSSEIPKSLRKLEIEVVSKNKNYVYSEIPKTSIQNDTYHIAKYEEIHAINFQPKCVTHYSSNIYLINREIMDDLSGEVSMYLKASFPNGRGFKAYLITDKLNRVM
jgi:hypothetical protein